MDSKIKIGDTIKRLRREKNITQEKLADVLNVSVPAVSKWERGECYPDITMLILLASYFKTSVDELLGVDEAKIEAEIQNYLAEITRLHNLGEQLRAQEVVFEAYSRFPHDFRIVDWYIQKLAYDERLVEQSGFDVYKEELTKLCDYVLEECDVDEIRYRTLYVLLGLSDDPASRLQIADRFPDVYLTRGSVRTDVFRRETPERVSYIRQFIAELVEMLSYEIRDIALEDKTLTLQEQITALEKAIAVLDIVYDRDDHCFKDYQLSDLYLWLAHRYIKAGNPDRGFECLKEGLSCAKNYDEIPREEGSNTSLLVKGNAFNMADVNSSFRSNVVKRQLEFLQQWD